MLYFSALLIWLIGGAAGRVRGQAEPWSHTVSRYGVWGVPVGILVLLFTHNPFYALASVACAGLGASLGYWGQFDFSAPGNWNVKNYITLTLTGMFRFTPLALLAIPVGLFWHVLPAVLAGAMFVPVYVFAFKYLSKINLNSYFNQPTCFAEFIFWGTIYLALAAGLYA